MTEKRFENRLNKSNVKFNTLNPVWDDEKENALNVFEMINELNYLNDCCDNLIDDNTEYVVEINQMHKENEKLKASLYAEKTNTAEVVNDYSKQFKRHSAQFSFMMDLAEDLGVNVTTLEALDD